MAFRGISVEARGLVPSRPRSDRLPRKAGLWPSCTKKSRSLSQLGYSGSCGVLRSEGLARELRSSQVVRRIRVVIGDRDPFIVRGLESILAAETGFEVVATCLDGIACMESIRDLSPDLALLCISLPLMSGVQILESINSERLRTRVVFISLPVDDSNGMNAYEVIPPDVTPQLLIRCLWKVASGEKLPPIAACD